MYITEQNCVIGMGMFVETTYVSAEYMVSTVFVIIINHEYNRATNKFNRKISNVHTMIISTHSSLCISYGSSSPNLEPGSVR
jgi:hypothetical protein